MGNFPTIGFSREVPIKYTPEVAVFGGGIAGTVAACAAAAAGKKVLLVEQFAVLGGVGTSGGVSGFCGETKGQGAIFDEIIHELEAHHAIRPYFPAHSVLFRGRLYDHELLAVILQEITIRHGIQLLFHTRLVDVIGNKDPATGINEIRGVIIHGKSGLAAVQAKMYLDCTGEADLARALGCTIMKGRPQDGLQLPMAMTFFTRTVGLLRPLKKIVTLNRTWKPLLTVNDLPMISFYPFGPSGKGIKVKIPKYDATDTDQLTAAEIYARQRMVQILEYLQRVRRKRWELDHCSMIIGIREGCRVEGEYILTVEDVRAGKEFPDAAAVGCYPLDAHKPDDDKKTYILPKDQLRVPPYQIPLRCLIPKGTKNFLVAGRNFSADQLAMSSARVMTSCAMMGQAAGEAAALAIDKQCEPKQIGLNYIRIYQEILKKNGCILDLSSYR